MLTREAHALSVIERTIFAAKIKKVRVAMFSQLVKYLRIQDIELAARSVINFK
jgi:hypothetical protein